MLLVLGSDYSRRHWVRQSLRHLVLPIYISEVRHSSSDSVRYNIVWERCFQGRYTIFHTGCFCRWFEVAGRGNSFLRRSSCNRYKECVSVSICYCDRRYVNSKKTHHAAIYLFKHFSACIVWLDTFTRRAKACQLITNDEYKHTP